MKQPDRQQDPTSRASSELAIPETDPASPAHSAGRRVMLGRRMMPGRQLRHLRTTETGLSTAEYAIGTIAVAGLGGLLIRLLTSDWFFGLLQGIFDRALGSVG